MFMMKNVLRNLLSRNATRKYPYVRREPFPYYRGPVQIDAEKCILCGICAKKCPSQCIAIDPKEGTWDLDLLACIYCASCVEACPKQCLSMGKEHPAPRLGHDHLVVYGTGKKKKARAEAGGKADASAADAGK